MALDKMVTDGDEVIFNPQFGVATVMVKPGSIKGSGKTAVSGKKVCLKGDEKQVIVHGCSYTCGSFTVPGTGDLKIHALLGNQLTQKSRSGGKPILLVGTVFQALFEVKSPAQQIVPGSSPQPDPVKIHMGGTGQFKSINRKIQAT